MTANTEIAVLAALGAEANRQRRIHDVMLMVELGDLREGLMPAQLDEAVRCVVTHPAMRLRGVGANLACRNGVEPSRENMTELSNLVDSIEERFGIGIDVVSGGNSANLGWAFGHNATGRVNNLRLGESVLLGLDPLHRTPIPGLHTDAVTVVAEVIESQHKPSKPWGRRSENAFGEIPEEQDHGDCWQTIFAVGRQDTDPEDLLAPAGITIAGASSDHLVTRTDRRMSPGEPVRFRPGYSALLRSATSPFVSTVFSMSSTTSFDHSVFA
jgi:predicted amino acid racemase